LQQTTLGATCAVLPLKQLAYSSSTTPHHHGVSSNPGTGVAVKFRIVLTLNSVHGRKLTGMLL